MENSGTGSRAARWAPWVALLAAAAWVYRDVIFDGAAFFGLDASLQQAAWRFLRHYVLNGYLPLWNPHVFCGSPLFADPHAQALYPPNLLLLLFGDTLRPWSFISMAHFLVAGGGTYLFGRALGFTRAGALTAGLAFMLCQFVQSITDEPVALHSTVWMPVILLSVHRGFHGRPRWLVAGGFAAGTMLLSTMFQYASCVLAVACAYGLFLAFETGEGRAPARLWRWALSLGSLLAIAVGVFAVQLLPLLEAKGLSARSLLGLDGAMGPPGESFSAYDILAMAIPSEFGGRAAFRNSHVGLATILLAAAAFVRGPRRAGWFFLGTAAVFLLLAAGRHTPVYATVHALHLPGFSLFKDPNRMSYPVYFCIAMLAGAGVASLQAAVARRAGEAAGAVLGWLLASLVAVNLLAFPHAQHNLKDRVGIERETSVDAAVGAIVADGARGRVYGAVPRLRLSRPILFGLHGADSWNTFVPLRYVQFTAGKVQVEPKSHTADPAILSSANRARLARIRYAYLTGIQAVALRLAPEFEPLAASGEGVVYRDPGTPPRVFVVPRAVAVPDAAAGLMYLDDQAFDPTGVVVLEMRPPAPPGGGTGTAEILADSPDRIEIEARTGGDSWLVVLDQHHPGWTATVDGRSADIVPADHAFRAVRLGEGRHRVVMTFRSRSLAAGAAVTALTVATAAVALAVVGRRRRGAG